jgi:hypothetical protein
VVRTVILDDASVGKRAAKRWSTEKEATVRVGVWMWLTDGSRSDDGRVGAAAVYKNRDEWRYRRRSLCTGRLEVFDAELWAIGLAFEETIENRDILQRHWVKMVAVVRNSEASIRRAAHLKPGPRQRHARRINPKPQALLAHGFKTQIHWVP